MRDDIDERKKIKLTEVPSEAPELVAVPDEAHEAVQRVRPGPVAEFDASYPIIQPPSLIEHLALLSKRTIWVLLFVSLACTISRMTEYWQVSAGVALFWGFESVMSWIHSRRAASFLKEQFGNRIPYHYTKVIRLEATRQDAFERVQSILVTHPDLQVTAIDTNTQTMTFYSKQRLLGCDIRLEQTCQVSSELDGSTQVSFSSRLIASDQHLSFIAAYLTGKHWLHIRLLERQAAKVDALACDVTTKFTKPISELRHAAIRAHCHRPDCLCNSVPDIGNPIQRWGSSFTAKYGLIAIILGSFVYCWSGLKPPTEPLVYIGMAFYCQLALAAAWGFHFHKFFELVKRASKGTFGLPSWQTIGLPALLNPATVPIGLTIGAVLIAQVFGLPGVRTNAQSQISAISVAISIVLSFSFLPIFVGSLAYLSLFHRVGSVLKDKRVQVPSSMWISIVAAVCFFAPIVVLGFNTHLTLLIIAYPLIQLLAYKLPFKILEDYYGAAREWIHRDNIQVPPPAVEQHTFMTPVWSTLRAIHTRVQRIDTTTLLLLYILLAATAFLVGGHVPGKLLQ